MIQRMVASERVRVQMKNRPQSEHKFSGSKKKSVWEFASTIEY